MQPDESRLGSVAEVNRAYYAEPRGGRDDYWRKMAAPRHRMATLVAEIRKAAPESLLDLGCGNGAVLCEILAQLPGTELAGIDLSEAQVAANRSRLPRIAWAALDLDAPVVPEPAWREHFAAVLATEVVEHVEHPLDFLRSARAFARPGGRLYLSTQSGPVRETERRVGHRRHFSAGEMRELLGEAGWRVASVWNTGFPFHDLSKWLANRDPDAAMQRFGERAYGWREDLLCAALRLAFRLNSRSRGAQLFAVAQRP
ncbi:MAG: class I SAM-dependent methyltransferase [Myxococcota bacterium]|nr:class I SAM-dependent methyltransferase [Myxococcota bacterium]